MRISCSEVSVLMLDDCQRAGFTYREANLVQYVFIDAAAPCSGTSNETSQPHLIRRGGIVSEAVARQPATASSTELCNPMAVSSPVILNTLLIRSVAVTTASDPPCSRTRLSAFYQHTKACGIQKLNCRQINHELIATGFNKSGQLLVQLGCGVDINFAADLDN